MFKKLCLVLLFGALMSSVCFAETAPVTANDATAVETFKKTVKKAKKKHTPKKTKEVKTDKTNK